MAAMVRTLSCAEQYRSMAFAQLTYRESPRDIETCLSVHASKLYHMGFRQPSGARRLSQRKARLAYPCGVGPAAHHPGEDAVRRRRTGVGPDQYRLRPGLDEIALCLSVFPWAHFRTTKAAVKMHTLLDLRGNIPSFIHISDGKLHDVHALYALAGSRSALRRGSWLRRLCPPLCVAPSRGLLHCVPSRTWSTDRSTGIICRPDHLPPSGLPRTSAAHPLPSPARRWSSSPTTSRFRPPPSARSTKAAGRWNSSSSGSSSIFGSSSSTARRRTR